MTGLAGRMVTVGNMFPPRDTHPEITSVVDDLIATCLVRAFQRARNRSYQDRRLLADDSAETELHVPYDTFSYHVITHSKHTFSSACQIRVYESENDQLHYQTTQFMVEKGMMTPAVLEEVRSWLSKVYRGPFAQVSGWLSCPGNPRGDGITLPSLCWAFTRLLVVPVAYAVSRIENGAADFLERMGGFAISGDYNSPYYHGPVRVLGFFPTEELTRRYERWVKQAEQFMRREATLYVGGRTIHQVEQDSLINSESIPIGGYGDQPLRGSGRASCRNP